jgi:prepilin-type N-terminal cleavage/methylation domain-containing protein
MKSNLKNLNSRFLILDSRKRLYPAPASFRSGAGFTLLELLVVIAIIAILIALGTISYSTAQKKSRDAKRSSDLKEIQNALETYHAINGAYPDADSETYPNPLEDDTTYFPSGNVPADPKTGLDYTGTYAADADSYCVCATLETLATGNASDTSCTYAAGGDYFCVSSLQ